MLSRLTIAGLRRLSRAVATSHHQASDFPVGNNSTVWTEYVVHKDTTLSVKLELHPVGSTAKVVEQSQ
jgi:hypothetical protein